MAQTPTDMGMAADEARPAQSASMDSEMLRARLEVAERVGELLAHELSNVLIVLRTHSELLVHHWDRLAEDQRRHSAETMEEEAEHLDDLLTTILDLARQQVRSYRPVHPASFLHRCVERATGITPGSSSGITISCPPDLYVETDPGLLEVAVRNLVDNALRHGRLPVLVSAQRDGAMFTVRVDDHGSGVSDEFEPRLFGRFQRADESVPGTGIGLSIVRDLLRLDSGTVRFIQHPGGASFAIELPDHGPGALNASAELHATTASEGYGVTPACDSESGSDRDDTNDEPVGPRPAGGAAPLVGS
jgi:signal transduction histidine kinase